MNNDAGRLLKRGVTLFSVFLVVFILARIYVSLNEETIPAHLRIQSLEPISENLFQREYQRWKVDEGKGPLLGQMRRLPALIASAVRTYVHKLLHLFPKPRVGFRDGHRAFDVNFWKQHAHRCHCHHHTVVLIG